MPFTEALLAALFCFAMVFVVLLLLYGLLQLFAMLVKTMSTGDQPNKTA